MQLPICIFCCSLFTQPKLLLSSLLKKVLDSESLFQSAIIVIPRFPRTQNEPSCVNFMGRIVSMLVKITDAQYTIYSLSKSGWYMKDQSEVCGMKTISLLRQAIGIYGLTGLDRLLCYRILHELHRFVKFFRTNVSKHAVLLEQLRDGVSMCDRGDTSNFIDFVF